MALKFIFGPSGSGKSCQLYQEIIEASMAHPERSYIVLVPEQFTMQTQKDLVSMHPRKGIMNIDVLSFGRLAYRVFEETGGSSLPVLDDEGKNLILRKIAGNYEDQLIVLKGNLKKQGYISEVKSVISEFTQYGIGFAELDEFMDFLKSNLKAQKLEDLKVPLIVTATDLDHGVSVHFHKGSIAERVAASCCMPVLFKPIKIDNTYYVDGGVLLNLPVSTIRRICEKVVAINVSPILAPKYKMNIVSIALRSYDFMFRSNTIAEREKADLLIECNKLSGYGNTELKKAKEIFDLGYNTANEVLQQLKDGDMMSIAGKG